MEDNSSSDLRWTWRLGGGEEINWKNHNLGNQNFK
jgi:hypothetical protein